MKLCGRCKQEKPLYEFFKNRSKPDGCQTYCKSCDRHYGAQFKCSQCGSDFKITHRNIRRRITRLCQSCAQKQAISKIIKSNKLRIKPEIFSTRGYEYLRDNKEKHGYMLAHRKIMANVLGRKLRRSEIVHHIDCNRLNNGPDNLWLTDQQGHKKAHRTLELIALEMMRKGKIRFNRESGEYELL